MSMGRLVLLLWLVAGPALAGTVEESPAQKFHLSE